MWTVEEIARVAHAANRELQRIQADPGIAVSPPWDDDTEETRSSVCAGVAAKLADPRIAAADSHEAWCEFKRAQGWVYGPVKDAEARTHPCLLPYHELPADQQRKDLLFTAIVGALGPR